MFFTQSSAIWFSLWKPQATGHYQIMHLMQPLTLKLIA